MLDVNNFSILKKYLTEKDIIDPNSTVLIQSLPGGVSNSVLKISCDRGQFVLKQALPKLKVTSEWVSDVARSNVEKQALKFLYRIIPGTTPDFYMRMKVIISLSWSVHLNQVLPGNHCY